MSDMKEILEKLMRENKIVFSEDYTKGIDEITGDNLTGGEVISTTKNRVFTNKFSVEYMEVLIKIFKGLNMNNFNSSRITFMINELDGIAREMMKSGEYALEAILYASKAINAILNNNDILIEQLGDLIKDVYEMSPVRNKEAAIYILNNWNWTPQLNILINAIGKIEDEELVEEAARIKSAGNKYEVFKCLINSGTRDYINTVLKIVSLTEWGTQEDNKIIKYFKGFYHVSFGQYGIDKALEYEKVPNLSARGKVELSNLLVGFKGSDISTSNVSEILSIGDIISLVKEDKFDKVKQIIINKKCRKNAFIAIRWANGKEDVAKVWRAMIAGLIKDDFSNAVENGEGLITLAKIGGIDETRKIAQKYILKKFAMEYAYCALAITGNPVYTQKVIDEAFNMNLSIYRVLKHCRKQIEMKLTQRVEEDMFSSNKKLVKKACEVSSRLANKEMFDFDKVYPKNLKRLFASENTVMQNEELRLELTKTIESLFNERTAESFTPVLFKIFKDPRSKAKEKVIANKLLLSMEIKPPK